MDSQKKYFFEGFFIVGVRRKEKIHVCKVGAINVTDGWELPSSPSQGTEFKAMLASELTIGRFGQDWAVVRLVEFVPYAEIIHILGCRQLIDGWPRWRKMFGVIRENVVLISLLNGYLNIVPS